MVALRSPRETDTDMPDEAGATPRPNPADWLPLQQAACELNVSISTVRRMIRKGQLRNRIVPRRGGFRYLIYLPNSRHTQMNALRFGLPAATAQAERRLRLVEAAPAGPWRSETTAQEAPAEEIQRLEAQLDHLSRSLARAIRERQASPPAGATGRSGNGGDPFARYRWLVRRGRRWWKR